jgi:hypothetical protein
MDEFKSWMISSSGKSETTAGKYAGAIYNISEEFLDGKNLYSIKSFLEVKNEIDYIFNLRDFQVKNKTGHNMYSCALNNYLEYVRIKDKN